MAKITVQNTQITVVTINERDYISLTDMVRNIENGLAFGKRCTIPILIPPNSRELKMPLD